MIQKFKTENHEEWLALRHKYIGGSDAPSIVGCNPYSSPLKLWLEKTDRAPAFEGNIATRFGTFAEEFVAQEFMRETGKKVRNCNLSMVNDQYPWAIANVDRLVVGEDAGLEIKTTSELNARKFRKQDGSEIDYPANYYVQSMHYMAVTGKAKWYLAVLIGNHDFRVYAIERDEDEIAALMEAESEFWFYVMNDTQPPIDGSKPTTEALNMMYPESKDRTVDLMPMDGLVEQYLGFERQIKDLERLRDSVGNQIKDYLGDAEKAESLKYKVTWKSASRSTFDSKRFAAEKGIDLTPWMKTSSYRTFKVGKAGAK